MGAPVQLVFFGEVIHGFELDEVRRRLGGLLKLDDAGQRRLFSGGRTVLKRSIERAEGERYAAQLAKIGARIHLEPADGADAAPAIEEIVCPNCGERQSKRILCRSCATDMPMGIAAKLEAEQQARAARLEESRARRGIRPATRSASSDAPGMWGLGFSGRIARLPYATANLLLITVLYLMVLFVLQRPGVGRVAVFGLVGLVLVVLSLRLAVLRFHDIDRSGWWCLLLLIPYLGFVVNLVLAFMPGTRGDNDHGDTPRDGQWLFLLLALVAMCLAIGLSFRVLLALVAGVAAGETGGADMNEPASMSLPSSDAAAAFRSQYAPAPLHKAFAVSESGAWGWKSGAASQDEAAEGALSNCEANRKPYSPACELISVR